MSKSAKLTRHEWTVLLSILAGIVLLLFIVWAILWLSHRSLAATSSEAAGSSPSAYAGESERLFYAYCGRYTDPQSEQSTITLASIIQNEVHPLELDELNARELQEGMWYEFIFAGDKVIGYQPLDVKIINDAGCD